MYRIFWDSWIINSKFKSFHVQKLSPSPHMFVLASLKNSETQNQSIFQSSNRIMTSAIVIDASHVIQFPKSESDNKYLAFMQTNQTIMYISILIVIMHCCSIIDVVCICVCNIYFYLTSHTKFLNLLYNIWIIQQSTDIRYNARFPCKPFKWYPYCTHLHHAYCQCI